jgi:hypothetical protein
VSNKTRREELKQFLRSRRARLSPSDFGFPTGTRRRTPGLRRDEVALLASMGTTTYTFLEQGRDINVSAPVVERLAQVLRLTPVEKRHLYELAIGDLPKLTGDNQAITELMQQMLNFLLPCPANLFNYRFDLLAFNRAAEMVFLYPHDAIAQRYNLLELLFLSPERQKLYVNLPLFMRNLIACFRLNYARYSDDDLLVEMVHDLEEKSPCFRKFWSEYYVLESEDVAKTLQLNHPALGKLEGNFNLFNVFGYGDLTLAVFTPAVGTDSLEKIKGALAQLSPAPV